MTRFVFVLRVVKKCYINLYAKKLRVKIEYQQVHVRAVSASVSWIRIQYADPGPGGKIFLIKTEKIQENC